MLTVVNECCDICLAPLPTLIKCFKVRVQPPGEVKDMVLCAGCCLELLGLLAKNHPEIPVERITS